MGGGTVLSLHLPEPANGRFRRHRSQLAYRCRPDLVPGCRNRNLPVARDRAQGNLRAGDQSRSGRSPLEFLPRRGRLLLLTIWTDENSMTHGTRLTAPAALI